MRVGLEVVAVLEGAGLALVGVDRHQPRPRLGADEAPLAPGREARAAEAAQPGSSSALRMLSSVALAGQALARAARSRRRRDRRRNRMESASADASRPRLDRRRRRSRPSRARAALADAATGALWQPPMQGARTTRTPAPSRAGSSASSSFAPSSAQVRLSQTRTVSGGGGRLAVHHDVEMGVEGGDLVDLDQRQPHLLAPAPPDGAHGGSRSGPGSGAGARSAGRGAAAGRRAAPGPRRAPAGRPAGPSAGLRPCAAGPSRDGCACSLRFVYDAPLAVFPDHLALRV